MSLGSSEFDADAQVENKLDGGVVLVLFVASEAELFDHPVTLIVEVGEALDMGESWRMSRSRVGRKAESSACKRWILSALEAAMARSMVVRHDSYREAAAGCRMSCG